EVYILFYCIFFFQAEDGIRDRTVTGVQTCALPISHDRVAADAGDGRVPEPELGQLVADLVGEGARARDEPDRAFAEDLGGDDSRSEERRVGKEGRNREWAEQDRKKG